MRLLCKWFAITCALMICGSGCVDKPPYLKCLDDSECVDFFNKYSSKKGRCLNSAYGPFCAFPDKDCPVMWIWWEYAHQAIANQCVDPSLPLDAAPDAPADMSPSQ